VADLGPVGEGIKKKLMDALSPSVLQVIDDSAAHHGHAGAHPAGESHFTVRIASPMLAGLSRVNQHRKVNEVLADDLKTRVHALAIEIVRG
jgi:BolA family transcriptional regulator, general stress-responsive regulator